MYTYENISTSDQHLVGFGTVGAGERIVVDRAVENPNFKFLGKDLEDAKITGIVQQSGNAVTEAEKIEPTEGVN